MKKQLTIVLAAGGTGGHIFPAEALREELTARGHKVVLITDKRYQQYIAEDQGKTLHIIPSASLGGGLIKTAKGVLAIACGYMKASQLLKQIAPDAVIGFGGYPSFPTMVAALRRRIKTVIHEQNSILGKVNAYLAPHVNHIATSFSEVKGIKEKDISRIRLIGNPVRHAIRAIREVPYPELSAEGVLRILVTGGSQGASVFSKVIPEAIALLPVSYRSRIRIDQQARKEDSDEVRRRYQELGVSADISSFFSDIPARLASAHLVISRAGASTLGELTVAGRPAILVPYPYATGNHQLYNANALEVRKGGWVMPQDAFTPEALSARIEGFLGSPSSLQQAAAKARECGFVDAAGNFANVIENLVINA